MKVWNKIKIFMQCLLVLIGLFIVLILLKIAEEEKTQENKLITNIELSKK